MSYKKILVPLDFSEHSARALDTAVELAQAFGASLELLHCTSIQPGAISPYGLVLPETFNNQLREAAARELGEWRERAVEKGVNANVNLSSLAPSLAISDSASSLGADLIVMGTRGLSGLKHVLLGSVAERTLRVAPCPVLTVKSGEGG